MTHRPVLYARPRVWGIPSPWSGDDYDAPTRWYWLWYGLYRRNQQLRHLLRLHTPEGSIWRRCSWCGKRLGL